MTGVDFAGTHWSWNPPANAACWVVHPWSMSWMNASPRSSRSGRKGSTSLAPVGLLFGWCHTGLPLRSTAGCGSPYPRTPCMVPK